MARCYINMTYHVPEPQPEPKPIQDVVLHMTVEEAGTLRQILFCIGGEPDGPRGTLENIGEAIRLAGVEKTKFKTEIYTGLGATYLRIEKGDS